MSDLADPRFLDERIAHWAETKPDDEAIDYLDRTWTWAQWNDRVRRLAGALKERGVERGDVVAFLDKNHPACVELTLAAASLGAANAIINFRLAADELDYVLNDSGAKVLIVGKELKPNVDKIRDKLTNVEHVIEVTPEGGTATSTRRCWPRRHRSTAATDVDPDDVAIIMYSSGTTGRPKGVAADAGQPHRAHCQRARGLRVRRGRQEHGVDAAVPRWRIVLRAVRHPRRLPSVMTRDVDGAALAGAILKGANRTFLVPAVLAKVLESGEDAVKLFGALKTFRVWRVADAASAAAQGAGGVAEHRLHAGVRADRARAASSATCFPRPIAIPAKRSDCPVRERWYPTRRCGWSTPTRSKDVPTGEQGELWFRSPQLMKGYHNKPEATEEAITDDGWFRTGDIGRVDDGGYIFVEDRLKDMIISGGENIYSIEVERVLAEHPAVVDVAIIGIPDDKWGEVVKAVVQLEGEADEKELIAFCRERLASYKCPKSVDVREELPRNPTGKILKKDLRKEYSEGGDRTTV